LSYFVCHLGNFTSSIYAEDCIFEDPTIKFSGKNRAFYQIIATCVAPTLLMEGVPGVQHDNNVITFY
jgi:hypothetical protein